MCKLKLPNPVWLSPWGVFVENIRAVNWSYATNVWCGDGYSQDFQQLKTPVGERNWCGVKLLKAH